MIADHYVDDPFVDSLHLRGHGPDAAAEAMAPCRPLTAFSRAVAAVLLARFRNRETPSCVDMTPLHSKFH